jgi:hypothetical protein
MRGRQGAARAEFALFSAPLSQFWPVHFQVAKFLKRHNNPVALQTLQVTGSATFYRLEQGKSPSGTCGPTGDSLEFVESPSGRQSTKQLVPEYADGHPGGFVASDLTL